MRLILATVTVLVAMPIVLVLIQLYVFGAQKFWENLLPNLVAELAGAALALGIGAWLALRVARDRLDTLGPRLIDLIARLRQDNVFEPETARACVVCAVAVLSEGGLRNLRPAGTSVRQECRVCSLDAEAEDTGGGRIRCSHCHLPSNLWELPPRGSRRGRGAVG